MKKGLHHLAFYLSCSVTVLSTTALSASVNSFDDITYWVGTGANQSALVIDFNDGSSVDSFAWGYNWDDPTSGDPKVSGAMMILEIAAIDPMLSIVNFGDAQSGFFLTEISYGGRTATTDFVFEGWGYYIAGGVAGGNEAGSGGTPPATSPTTIPSGGTNLPFWTASNAGASVSSSLEGTTYFGRILADGAWDAWSFGGLSVDFEHLAPPSGPIAAAPEPSSFAFLIGLISFTGVALRRSQRTAKR